jgi:diamine N-acetyltransferase
MQRNADSGAVVSLREINAGTVRAICRLDVGAAQGGLVAPNAWSMSEAIFEPAAWFRAIYAGEAPVGFVMLYDPTRTPTPEAPGVCFLWRLMIDARHQRRGYGAAAMRLVFDHVATLPGVHTLRSSYVPKDGSAAAFYARLGFRETGAIDDGERVIERAAGQRSG